MNYSQSANNINWDPFPWAKADIEALRLAASQDASTADDYQVESTSHSGNAASYFEPPAITTRPNTVLDDGSLATGGSALNSALLNFKEVANYAHSRQRRLQQDDQTGEPHSSPMHSEHLQALLFGGQNEAAQFADDSAPDPLGYVNIQPSGSQYSPQQLLPERQGQNSLYHPYSWWLNHPLVAGDNYSHLQVGLPRPEPQMPNDLHGTAGASLSSEEREYTDWQWDPNFSELQRDLQLYPTPSSSMGSMNQQSVADLSSPLRWTPASERPLRDEEGEPRNMASPTSNYPGSSNDLPRDDPVTLHNVDEGPPPDTSPNQTTNNRVLLLEGPSWRPRGLVDVLASCSATGCPSKRFVSLTNINSWASFSPKHIQELVEKIRPVCSLKCFNELITGAAPLRVGKGGRLTGKSKAEELAKSHNIVCMCMLCGTTSATVSKFIPLRRQAPVLTVNGIFKCYDHKSEATRDLSEEIPSTPGSLPAAVLETLRAQYTSKSHYNGRFRARLSAAPRFREPLSAGLSDSEDVRLVCSVDRCSRGILIRQTDLPNPSRPLDIKGVCSIQHFNEQAQLSVARRSSGNSHFSMAEIEQMREMAGTHRLHPMCMLCSTYGPHAKSRLCPIDDKLLCTQDGYFGCSLHSLTLVGAITNLDDFVG